MTRQSPHGDRGPIHNRSAFTLVEMLIAVVMLAILAAIVIPRFVLAQDEAEELALTTDLRALRLQVESYKVQHDGRLPLFDENGNLDSGNLVARLTGRTDIDGKINSSGDSGPYMFEWPANPFADRDVAASIAFGDTVRPLRLFIEHGDPAHAVAQSA